MTIRFLTAQDGYAANSVVTLEAERERRYVAANVATYDVRGGNAQAPVDKIALPLTRIPDAQAAALAASSTFRDNRAVFGFVGDPVIANMSGIVTWQYQAEVDGDFDAIEFLFGGFGAATYAIRASCCSSESLSSDIYPVVGGSNVTSSSGWADITVGGGTTITAPVSPGTDKMDVVASDLIPLSSLPRTDTSSNKRILMIRMVIPNTANFTQMNLTPAGLAELTSRSGFSNKGKYTYADCIASYPAASALEDVVGKLPFVSFKVHYRDPARSGFVASGDSTYALVGSTTTTGTFPQLATELLTAQGKKCSVVSSGWAGKNSATNLHRVQKLCSNKPRFALYQPYSVNDAGAGTTASVGPALQHAAVFKDFCIRNGIFCLMSAPFPVGAAGVAMPASTLAIRAGILAMQGPNTFVLDIPSLMGDSGYGWVNAYRYDDNHPNDVGRAVLASALAALISPLV